MKNIFVLLLLVTYLQGKKHIIQTSNNTYLAKMKQSMGSSLDYQARLPPCSSYPGPMRSYDIPLDGGNINIMCNPPGADRRHRVKRQIMQPCITIHKIMVGCSSNEPLVPAHKDLVERMCSGKTSCSVDPTSLMFNENCQGWRRMWITYSCDSGGVDMTTKYIPPRKISKGGPHCEDGNSKCPELARNGECRKNPDWMLASCKKSCNVCTGFSICPRGWTSLGSKCYKVFHTKKSWKDAEAHCRGEGGHLASIHSARENEFVRSLDPGHLWLGGTDENTEGRWRWTDGSDFKFKSWHSGEPNNLGSEHCVHTGRKLTWNDNDCSDKYKYVCQRFNQNAEIKIEKGKRLGNIDYIGKDYSVSFEILIEKNQAAGYGSVLHMTVGRDCSNRGDRLPMVTLRAKDKFIVVSDLNPHNKCGQGWNEFDFGPIGLEVGKWATVDITQQKKFCGVYVFEIKINGKRIQMSINQDPKKYENVIVYVGSPWYNAAAAKIRNLVIKSEEE